jgi:16S rRNA (cytosine1402-N4)-methyltransferase
MAVNDELKSLRGLLEDGPACVRAGGLLAAISFHSLEDRMVKDAFKRDVRLKSQTKRPVVPSEQEIEVNPRSRSAKLRLAWRRIEGP